MLRCFPMTVSPISFGSWMKCSARLMGSRLYFLTTSEGSISQWFSTTVIEDLMVSDKYLAFILLICGYTG